MELSEGRVCIRRGLVGPGNLVHTEGTGSFVTLYGHRALDLNRADVIPTDAVAVNPPNVDLPSLRISIGNAQTAIVVDMADFGLILRNIYVAAGEEIWVAADKQDRVVVYGFATAAPTT